MGGWVLRCAPVVGFGAAASGVAEGWVERGGRARQRGRESEEGLELHDEGKAMIDCGERMT